MVAMARCAECGAVLASGAQWCSLCLTPIPAPTSPTTADMPSATAPPGQPTPPTVAPLPPPPPGATPVLPPSASATSPISTSGNRDPGSGAHPGTGTGTDADPEAWLAKLAAAERQDPTPLATTFATRSGRILVMIVGMVIVIISLALITFVIGRFAG